MSEQTLDISWQAIVKVLLAGAALYVLFLIKDVVIWFFFALVISLLLNPAVEFLRKFHIPRFAAVTLVYIAILGALGLMIYLTAPIFIFEIGQLSENLPVYFEKFNPILSGLGFEVAHSFEDFTAGLMAGLQDSSAGVIQALGVFFGGLYSTFVIFTMAFFISLEKKGTQNVLKLLTPKKYEGVVINFFDRAQGKVSGWFGAGCWLAL